ncbi:MAG: ATP-binding protein [Chitinophagia bacterium]|nr:ATP-binding protein [Chitinophagia bacterium]
MVGLQGEVNMEESDLIYEKFAEGKKRRLETFDRITGCESAKRAVAIAVAGRHNLLMVGPPGTGKTLLAKSINEIVPTLTKEESFECTALGQLNNRDITEPIIFPPFREPHHTSSYSAIIGDAQLNAGEITKAHNGFLFLDEIPEFESRVIDSLREPLESGKLMLSKQKGSVNMPANFTLIATMNPCKCGFRGSTYRRCICRNVDAIKYANKISGPILDRFDMVVHVDVISEGDNKEENLHTKIKEAVLFSHKRYPLFNGKLKITHAIKLTPNVKDSLDQITKGLNLSKRSIVKIIKVARTIADLEKSEEIQPEHLYEAVAYRQGIV